ncbi:NAD-dependent epimerase/dehydratase family protein [Microcoleus sp. herbarium2]|uniref:NAD-dependent epimerase/dehydratase family protein n=1 Tax=Microcoleus sp. herbarium2 TaxID=3055433 RepID=UPI004040AF81
MLAVSDNVDRPISLYAATKKAKELMAHSYSYLYNLSTTGLRFFTVYGSWGRPDMADFKLVNLSVFFPTNLCLFLGKTIGLALNLSCL